MQAIDEHWLSCSTGREPKGWDRISLLLRDTLEKPRKLRWKREPCCRQCVGMIIPQCLQERVEIGEPTRHAPAQFGSQAANHPTPRIVAPVGMPFLRAHETDQTASTARGHTLDQSLVYMTRCFKDYDRTVPVILPQNLLTLTTQDAELRPFIIPFVIRFIVITAKSCRFQCR